RPRRRDPVLDDLHVQRLQHRLRAHAGRPRQHHPSLRDAGLPDRAQRGQPRAGGGHLALPVPDAGGRGLFPTAVHSEGMTVAIAGSRAARIRSTASTYANLVPFLFFALFPFYFMLITSFKSNAELYDLKSVPFLIQTGVITDHYRYLVRRSASLVWMKNGRATSVAAPRMSLMMFMLAG